jgi:hypothetical protein
MLHMCEFLGGQIIIEGSWKAQTYLSSSEPAPSLTGAQHRAGDLRHTRRRLVLRPRKHHCTSGVSAFATLTGTATAESVGLEASDCPVIPLWLEAAAGRSASLLCEVHDGNCRLHRRRHGASAVPDGTGKSGAAA